MLIGGVEVYVLSCLDRFCPVACCFVLCPVMLSCVTLSCLVLPVNASVFLASAVFFASNVCCAVATFVV